MRKQEIVNFLHRVKIFPLFRNVALEVSSGWSVASTGSATVVLSIFLDTRSRFLQPDICRCGNEDRRHLPNKVVSEHSFFFHVVGQIFHQIARTECVKDIIRRNDVII